MRHLVVSLFLSMSLVVLSAQAPAFALTPQEIEIQKDLRRAERKAIVAQNMSLTEDQAAVFWPIYEAHRERVGVQIDRTTSIIGQHAAEWQNLPEDEADLIAQQLLETELSLAELRRQLKDELSAVLSAKITLRYLQVDARLDTLLRAQVSSMVPLVGMQPVMVGDAI